MSDLLTPDICVIGAGTGGLVVAAGASQLGAKTVLIESHRMGGDCLNTGCVPSKALLAAAHAATDYRRGAAFGLAQDAPRVDFAKVQAHVRAVIAAIAPNDSEERFTGLGVTVLREPGRFTGPSEVSVVEMLEIMPKDDPELVAVVRQSLLDDGIALFEQHKVVGASKSGANLALEIEKDGMRRRLEGSHLLVAAGRRPQVADLGLESAGIAHSDKGIQVDARLRTTNRRAYAVGDVVGGPQFTHLAAYHAGIVIRTALFRLPARVDLSALPWVTFTNPELAHVGSSEAAARSQGPIRLLRWPLAENDRAQAEHLHRGFIKIVTNMRGRILGADVVGPSAGEMIHFWTLAVSQKLKIGAVAGMIAPYPTLSEIGKRAAGNFFLPKLFSDRSRR